MSGPELHGELSSHDRTALRRMADAELRTRSYAGAFMYFGFILLLALTSPYLHDYPQLILGMGVVTLALGILRFLLARSFDRLYARDPERWWHLFAAGVFAAGTVWGVFAALTIGFYQVSWTALLVVIITAGTGVAATAGLAPDIRLARIYMPLMGGPSLVACFWLGGPHGQAMGVLFAVFLLYMGYQAHRQHVDYWNALRRTRLLRIQTEQLQAAKQKAVAASRAKSEFLSNMSHEIRTPLNAIIGMTEVVLTAETDRVRGEHLRLVLASAEALLGIVNEILDLSKIEAGGLRFEEHRFALAESLQGIVRSLAPRAGKKGLALRCRVLPGVPDEVVGDSLRLRQVIVNLLGNALKFTERGEVTLRIGVEASSETEVTLRFVVRDTGIGIAPEKQQAIFEAFTQADGSTTRRYGGTGLGLAIASRLVERMGGQLTLASQMGRGSTFSFTARFGRAHPGRQAA